MRKILVVGAFGFSVVACGVGAESESLGTGEQNSTSDISSTKKRADGNFDVVCADGTTEVRSVKELLTDQVCTSAVDAGSGKVEGETLAVPSVVGKAASVDVITSTTQTGIVHIGSGAYGQKPETDQRPYTLVTLTNPTNKRAIVSVWSAPAAGGSNLNTSMALYKIAPTTQAEVDAFIGSVATKCESAPCSLDHTYASSYDQYTNWAGFVSGDNRPIDLGPGERVVVRVGSLNGTGFFQVHARTDALLPALGILDGVLEINANVSGSVSTQVAASAAKTGIVHIGSGAYGQKPETDQRPYALVKLTNASAKRAVVSVWSAPAAGGSNLNTSMALYKTVPTTQAEVDAFIGSVATKCESAPCSLDHTYASSYDQYTNWAGFVSGDNRPIDLAPGESVFVRIGALNGTGLFTLNAKTDLLK